VRIENAHPVLPGQLLQRLLGIGHKQPSAPFRAGETREHEKAVKAAREAEWSSETHSIYGMPESARSAYR
jgi:hypothetical protein